MTADASSAVTPAAVEAIFIQLQGHSPCTSHVEASWHRRTATPGIPARPHPISKGNYIRECPTNRWLSSCTCVQLG